jgi:regulator of nonsense transcripts 1
LIQNFKEATQATEPTLLVPLMHRSKQLFLLGDHFQLPPTVISERARAQGLGTSLFSRLVDQGIQPILLTMQYRMHPSLSEFPSQEFYSRKLVDGVTSESRPAPTGFPFPSTEHPVALVQVSNGVEDVTSEGSRFNPQEAKVLLEVIRLLLTSGDLQPKQLGVVTPYSGQVRHLNTLFSEDPDAAIWANDVDISSVDGYQGREKEVIIFSTVRSNKEGNVGFLSDWRRLNVALTRARRGLIVIGNKNTLRHDEHWKHWIQWIQKKRLVIPGFYFKTKEKAQRYLQRHLEKQQNHKESSKEDKENEDQENQISEDEEFNDIETDVDVNVNVADELKENEQQNIVIEQDSTSKEQTNENENENANENENNK